MSMLSPILAQLDSDDLAVLAAALAPHLPTGSPDGWLDSKRAADYLGVTVPALDKLCASGAVEFTQHSDHGKRWFHRRDLDRYRGRA
jgi:hypothetical protein